ncbi:MOSC domain-containing protein [bacterium]|nr:MOSC domain-containing protein [bacterium]
MVDESFNELKQRTAQPGRVEWIGLCTERRGAVRSVESATARERTGLEGDHHAANGSPKRQVTLIQAEHLPVVASLTGREFLTPDLLRRNVLVSGINLLALKDQKFRIGTALLEGTGPCVPCSRMEEVLGTGGYNAMRGHGGICARVLEPGELRVGDEVRLIVEDSSEADHSSQQPTLF